MTRTVTIQTRDHGPVTVPEPTWCTEDHARGEAYREDVVHTAENVWMKVPTPCHGAAYMAPSGWVLRPFHTDPRPQLAIELDQWHDLEPDAVDAVALAFEAHAVVLRGQAAELRTMRGDS